MTEDYNTETPMPKSEHRKFWNRIKKIGLYATSIAGAIVTIIAIFDFIQGNHKHHDLTGAWHFQFTLHPPLAIELKGLQENYNISIRQSGSRNEIVQGSGNYCAESGNPDSAHFTDHLIIVGSKFDDDSVLLNYDRLNHSEVISNGVIKFGIIPKKDGRYNGFFYDSADDTIGTVKAYRRLCIRE